MRKTLIILSFLIVGIVVFTNEPPIYSKTKDKDYKEEHYDISSLSNDIYSKANKVRQEQIALSKAIKSLKKENISLKNELSEIKEVKISDVITDSVIVEADSVVVPKKKGIIKRVFGGK